MKAKYIFRGFGLGVIITAVIMSAYTRSAVADARVNVLKEYGLGEEAALAETLVDVPGNDDSDAQKNENDNSVEVVPFNENPTVAENKVDEQIPAQTQVIPENVPDSDGDVNADAQGDGEDVENAQTPNSVIVVVPSDERDGAEAADTVTIVISQGDDSGTVARKLHSAGLIDNAAEFDAFLIQHGYDKKMRAGTKSISKDASWQEIADRLAR